MPCILPFSMELYNNERNVTFLKTRYVNNSYKCLADVLCCQYQTSLLLTGNFAIKHTGKNSITSYDGFGPATITIHTAGRVKTSARLAFEKQVKIFRPAASPPLRFYHFPKCRPMTIYLPSFFESIMNQHLKSTNKTFGVRRTSYQRVNRLPKGTFSVQFLSGSQINHT